MRNQNQLNKTLESLLAQYFKPIGPKLVNEQSLQK